MQFAVAFPQSGSSSTESKLELRNIDFCGGRKNRPDRSKGENQQTTLLTY
jgi:hypothetical protein